MRSERDGRSVGECAVSLGDTCKEPIQQEHFIMRFKGKIAVITGGANGIGEATALLMAREGAKIAVVDIDPTRLENVVRAIQTQGGEAIYAETDVLNEQAVGGMVHQVLD